MFAVTISEARKKKWSCSRRILPSIFMPNLQRKFDVICNTSALPLALPTKTSSLSILIKLWWRLGNGNGLMAYGGVELMVLLIRNLRNRWKWVASFYTLATLPLGKAPYSSWLGGWVDPLAALCLLEKMTHSSSFLLLRIKENLNCTAYSIRTSVCNILGNSLRMAWKEAVLYHIWGQESNIFLGTGRKNTKNLHVFKNA
jgi:hypothetical protein